MKLAVKCVKAHDLCDGFGQCLYCELVWPPRDEDTGKFVSYKEYQDGETPR